MELGGNSANLVLRDADVAEAVAACVRGAFSNSGQSCNSVQRIIVDRQVADAFVEEFASGMAALRVGDPFDEETQVAGVSSLDAAQRIETWIAEAVSDGDARGRRQLPPGRLRVRRGEGVGVGREDPASSVLQMSEEHPVVLGERRGLT